MKYQVDLKLLINEILLVIFFSFFKPIVVIYKPGPAQVGAISKAQK